MDTEKIKELVLNCMTQQLDGANLTLTLETALIGSERVLDSMGLVNLLIDIESTLAEENIDITLMSENAMSSRISPFRTIGSLIRYIDEILKNRD